MSYRTPAIALAFVAGTSLAAAAFAQSAPEPDNGDPLTRSRQLPEYTDSGDLKLPTNLASMGLCRRAIDPQRAQ